MTVVGDVIAVDNATRMITVKGPKRTVEFVVKDPEQFKLIAKGDQLEATYVEAVAVAVTRRPPRRSSLRPAVGARHAPGRTRPRPARGRVGGWQ